MATSPLRCSPDLLLLLLSFIVLFSVIDAAASTELGGLTPIKNPRTDRHVQVLGRFAVGEYNRRKDKNSKPLTFAAVTSGKQQVVAGLKYYLDVATSVGGVRRVFIAAVWVKPDDSRHLVSFEPLLS